MAEEEKDGALAPAEPQHTPLSEIVDKPRLADPPSKAVTDEPRAEPKPKREKVEKPDDEARFRGLLNETLGEREKRQAAERERDQYKQAWAEHQRKLAADQEHDPAPDQFRDPKAYNAWVERQMDKRAESYAQRHIAPLQEQVRDAHFNLSMMRAKEHLGVEKFGKMEEWIQAQWKDPRGAQVMQWCLDQPDPYHAAYQQYRQRTTFERLGNDDLDTYEQKLRDKILAELKGPIDPSNGIDEDDADFDTPKPRQAAPRSFASSRSSDPSRDQGGRFAGPRPLGELVKEKDQRRKR